MPWPLFALLLFQQPSFEVATVKPTTQRTHAVGTILTFPGGRLTAEGCTLEYLVEEAFSVQRFQVSGGPDWTYVDGFNIEARPPAASKSSKANPPYPKGPPNDEQRLMLQALLIDRFQLRYHRETKQGPVYLFLRTNKKLKLKEAKNKDAYPWAGGPGGGGLIETGIAGINISMPLLAARLSRWLDRPVLDRTGLEGSFDFKVQYESGNTKPELDASILIAIQALGLKLESAKGPVETIVIDHAEKPSAN
jgi:uncharacterized protein (TIGR03435 family)